MLRINIAFRLPKEVEHEAIGIATSLAKTKDNFFFLDGVTVLPHVTLYAPVVLDEKIDEVLICIEKTVADFSRVYFTLKERSTDQGFVGIEFGLIPEIKAMQEKIIASVEPLRVQDVEERYYNGADYKMNLSFGALQSLEKYGAVGIINFHPHLTFFRLKSEIDAELAKRKVIWGLPRFLVSKIGVFAMGEHGICQELIAEFPLKTP